MAPMPPAPRDERPHPVPAGVDGWAEAWTFDFATADAHLAGRVRFVRLPDHAWYEAVLAGAHRSLLAVLDHEVPFRSSPFEVRTTGLWADHVCEEPFEHWTLGLEAFALGVDDPGELLGRQHGDQVPLGFDLEWEADGPVLDDPPAPGATGYGVPCRVHGEVLVGQASVDVEAVGHRTHRWGRPDETGWSLAGTVEGGERWVVHAGPDGSVVRVVAAGGEVRTVDARPDLRRDRRGLPLASSVGDDLAAEVLAPVPVPLPGGRVHASALCRLRAADGRTGVGWLESSGAAGAVGA